MQTVRIRNLTFQYPHHTRLLDQLNATFKEGTISLITGRSGTGKSTLLKIMARLTVVKRPNRGMITYGSRLLNQIPAARLSNYVAMMFQDPNRQFAMRTVKHELIFTLENRQVPRNRIAENVRQVLVNNHLTRFKDRKLATLSGGEKQRVALAIITALNSKVILLDEPFTNVDTESRHRIMRKLVSLKHAGKVIVIVDHDLRGYRSITDQLLMMKHGRLYKTDFDQFKAQLRRPNYQWRLPKSGLKAVYQLRRFEVGYRQPLIEPTDLKFYQHHATLITGPNGSGKSTLFKALLKLIKHHGEITYLGTPLNKVKDKRYYPRVNLIFQEATDQFLEITVKQELELSIKNAVHRYYSRSTIERWLKFTGLDKHLNQIVYSLSGGQKKALQIIEVLINGAPVLLMDEPFQSLDHRLIRFFKNLLKDAVKDHGRTLIVISHQVAPVADLFDYHVQLSDRHLRYQRRLSL